MSKDRKLIERVVNDGSLCQNVSQEVNIYAFSLS
jgi:hypothetical protein